MRNLKKVLALVLAMAMSLSLAVTAGAAFNDQDKIVNTEAVDMCVALNIINGRTNGDFDPAGNVTRAEMAKMICIVLNGGKEPTTATKAVPTFADIDGHWAEGYIEYCFAKGVVAGKSATEFAPNAGVTGTEAAKMLLVALGYNADVEKMVGANWALYTNVLANQDGLYEDLEAMDPGAALSRDNAAQMIWNALNAEVIKVTSSIDRNDGSIIDSYSKIEGYELLEAKYGTSEFEGRLVDWTYNTDKAEWTYSLAYTAENGTATKSFTTGEDFTDLFMQNVKVIYKAKDVFGIFANDSTVIVEDIIGNIDDLATLGTTTDKVTVADVEYKVDMEDGANVITGAFPFGVNDDDSFRTIAALKGYEAFSFKAIDNDDNGKIDTLVYFPFSVSDVTYIGSETFNVTGKTGIEFEAVNVYDGMAKEDNVVITAGANTVDEKDLFEEASVASGEVTVKNGSDYTIGGEVYTAISALDEDSTKALTLGAEVEIVTVNGYIFAAEKTSASVTLSDIVYINGTEATTSYGETTLMARAIFTDGSTAEIEIASVDGTDAVVVADNKTTVATVADGLWAFEVEDGEYKLATITEDQTVDGAKVEGDFDKIATSGQTGDDRIAGLRANADAVVFVKDKDGDISVLTGADVMAWAKKDVTVKAFANTSNGYNYVELAAVELTTDIPGASANDVYGYIVAVLGLTKEDKTEYVSYSVWNGTETVTVKVENKEAYAEIAKGDFIKVSDDVVTELSQKVAIQAYDGKYVTFRGVVDEDGAQKEFEVTADTKVIFVNTDKVVGSTEGAITVATDHNTVDNFELNAVYAEGDTAGELAVLFVDVNNELK